IDLDSKPQVVEFDGFAPYSSGSERAEATQGEAGQSGGGVVAGRSVESSRFSTPESPPVIQESEPLGREIGLGYDSNYAYRGVDGGSDETLKLGLPAEVIEVDGISPDIADGGASRVYGSGGTAGRGGTRVEELALILPSQVRQQERSDTDSTHSLGLSSDDPFGGGAVVESVVPANEKQPESRVASQAGADAYAGVQIGQAFGRAENEVADLEDQIITTRGEANVREYGLEDVEARLSAGMAGKEVGRLESKSAPTPAQQKIVEPEEADESLAPSAGGGEGNTMLYSRLSRAEDTQRGLVRLREADQMVRQGNFEDAQEIVDESLRDKDGEVREAATRMKARLGDSEFYNPAQSEESVREVDKVQGLLEKAWGARQLGRFDEAEAAYDQALRIDPYNKAAQRGIEETENIRRPYYSAAFDSTRATMVRQVDSSQKTAMAPVTISRGSVSEEVSLEDWDPDFSGHLGDSLEALRLRESVLKYHMAKQESEAVEEELARLRVNATTPHLYGSPDFSSASRRMERKGADRLVEKSKESKSRINEARADVVRQKAKLKRGESKLLNQKLDLGGQQEYLSLVSEKLQVESEARNAESYLGVLKGLKGDELILAISKLGLAESDEISGYIASYLVAQDLLYEITKNDSVSREYAKSVNEEFVELQRKLIGLTEKVRSDLESELDLKRARLDELRGLVSAQLSDLIEVRSVLGEVSTVTEPFSTFSLHVGDVSFKLAKSALAEGKWPEADRIRIEEFVNAFDYADPMPGAREKVACAQEQAAHPFLQQRNLLLVSMRTAAEGRSGGTPLRLTLLLDASGSMEREDRRQSVNMAMGQLAAQLREGDLVSLITFARTPRLVAEGVPASEVHELVDRVRNLPSEGGTNLEAALRLAIEKALEHKDEAAQNRIILITDGAANLGDADPASLAVLIEEMRNKGIAFDATGIVADGLNDEILEALTRKGDGRYYLLDRPEDADERFAKQIAGALRPAAKNVKVQVEFNPERVKSYNLLGFEKHRLEKEDFRNDKVDAAEMAAAEAGVALYHYELIPDGEGDVGSVSVRFRDMSSGRMVERRWPIPFSTSVPSLDQATDSMRLASIAALTAAKLKGDVLGDFVDWEWLANSSRSLSRIFQQQERVSELITLISQARGIARK
ncbi:MAG: von Willebrand factor type A domain-containing protein, partial [Verrucomicrobiota bacterium]